MRRIFASLVAAAALLLGLGLSASAGTSPVAGTWAIADLGPGGWAGGNLMSDGTAMGSGQLAFPTPAGEEVAQITATNWSLASSSSINLCFTVTGKQGPVFPVGVPIPQCFFSLPATGGPVVISEAGGSMLIRVTLNGS